MAQAQPLPEYELQRKRFAQQNQHQGDRQRTALHRQLSRMGGGPSGAGIKLEQEIEGEIADRGRGGMADIDSQEMAAQRQMQEIEKQRQFTRGEREAGQQFMSEEGGRQRAFQSGERKGSEAFQGAESDKQIGFQNKLFEFDKSHKMNLLDLAYKQYDDDARTTEYNKFVSTLALPNDGDGPGLAAIIEDPNTSEGGRQAAYRFINGNPHGRANFWKNKRYDSESGQWVEDVTKHPLYNQKPNEWFPGGGPKGPAVAPPPPQGGGGAGARPGLGHGPGHGGRPYAGPPRGWGHGPGGHQRG